MVTQTISPDLLSDIACVIAEASMELPPLVNAYDADFLRKMTSKAMGIFFDRYSTLVGGSARSEWLNAAQNNDLDALADWVDAYADLELDAVARERALKALAEVKVELVKSIKDDYESFVRNLPQAMPV